jgi:hypothetical protein
MVKKVRRVVPCNNCNKSKMNEKALQETLAAAQHENNTLLCELSKKSKEVEEWKERYFELVNNGSFNYYQVFSNSSDPELLEIPAYSTYFTLLLQKFPILQIILQFFTSKSHIRKLNASATHFSWIHWSNFYRSFIADTFLRAKAPKTIQKSNWTLSAYFLLANMSGPCWKVLQRLKIVVSKEKFKQWVLQHEKKIEFENSVLIYIAVSTNMSHTPSLLTIQTSCTSLHIIQLKSLPVWTLWQQIFGDQWI